MRKIASLKLICQVFICKKYGEKVLDFLIDNKKIPIELKPLKLLFGYKYRRQKEGYLINNNMLSYYLCNQYILWAKLESSEKIKLRECSSVKMPIARIID